MRGLEGGELKLNMGWSEGGGGSSHSSGTSSPEWNSMFVRSGRDEEAVPTLEGAERVLGNGVSGL